MSKAGSVKSFEAKEAETVSSSSSSSSSLPKGSDADSSSANTYPFWHNLLAGGFSGAGSRVATAPLDLIRIRRQLAPPVVYPSESLWGTWAKIMKEEGGISALFRGNLAAIYLWVGYSAVQFSLYSHMRDYIQSRGGSSAVAAFGAGAAAGMCATLATYPFDLCRTTFAARGISPIETSRTVPFSSLVEPQYHHRTNIQPPASTSTTTTTTTMRWHGNAPPKTLREFTVQLYQQKGIRGFYYGANPAVVQIIPYMGLNFMIYDALLAGDKRVQQSGYAGAISGATSKIIVYPIDTVKKRLQAQAFYSATTDLHSVGGRSSSKSRKYAGMMDCTLRIAREEGFYSFYRGLLPSVLKTVIASSLSFALFRFGKNTLELVHDMPPTR